MIQSPGTRKGKKCEGSSSFQDILPQQPTEATNPAQPSPFLLISRQNLSVLKMYFVLQEEGMP